MITPEIMLEILKIGGVPALSVVVIVVVWLRQGPDRKTSAEDALSSEVASLRASVQNHDVRIAVIETTLKERGRK